ncbi:MAG: TerC family protein [Candidatus Acidiferrum sp.]
MSDPLLWIGFNLFVLLAISLDLGVFHRKPRAIGLREAALWSFVWVCLSVAFSVGMRFWSGPEAALSFFTGYLIEKALSVDNLFLFLVIFRTFQIDERLQHRILAWGIFGALVMRGAMIAAGAALVTRFSWVMYFFGGFLLYAGLHMIFAKEEKKKIHPEENSLFRFAARHLRVTKEFQGSHFFVRQNGLLFATPLLLVLLIVEITDVTLAADSIPAIFGITRDAFIVYTSNVFAILGLRAMYFLLAGMLDRLRYLDEGLAAVLIFIGGKMLAEQWVHISTGISMGVVCGMLAIALAASFLASTKADQK